jgi:hypothetical protein
MIVNDKFFEIILIYISKYIIIYTNKIDIISRKISRKKYISKSRKNYNKIVAIIFYNFLT